MVKMIYFDIIFHINQYIILKNDKIKSQLENDNKSLISLKGNYAGLYSFKYKNA